MTHGFISLLKGPIQKSILPEDIKKVKSVWGKKAFFNIHIFKCCVGLFPLLYILFELRSRVNGSYLFDQKNNLNSVFMDSTFLFKCLRHQQFSTCFCYLHEFDGHLIIDGFFGTDGKQTLPELRNGHIITVANQHGAERTPEADPLQIFAGIKHALVEGTWKNDSWKSIQHFLSKLHKKQISLLHSEDWAKSERKGRPLGTMNISTMFLRRPSSSFWDISVRTSVGGGRATHWRAANTNMKNEFYDNGLIVPSRFRWPLESILPQKHPPSAITARD